MNVEVLVRRAYTPRQIKRAELARTEFRRNPYTSGSANLDNMVALDKAVILCGDHTRKFNARVAHYELHPAKNMRRVQGNCDVCKMYGLATLFLPESLAIDERRKWELYRSAVEYGNLYRG